MCLIVDSRAQEKVATTPIICYKYLSPGRNSPVYDHKWELFRKARYALLRREVNSSRYGTYNEGYHARIKKNELTNYLFIVPIDTRYIIGNTPRFPTELVASSMICLGKCNWITRLIAKYIYKARELDSDYN